MELTSHLEHQETIWMNFLCKCHAEDGSRFETKINNEVITQIVSFSRWLENFKMQCLDFFSTRKHFKSTNVQVSEYHLTPPFLLNPILILFLDLFEKSNVYIKLATLKYTNGIQISKNTQVIKASSVQRATKNCTKKIPLYLNFIFK